MSVLISKTRTYEVTSITCFQKHANGRAKCWHCEEKPPDMTMMSEVIIKPGGEKWVCADCAAILFDALEEEKP